MQKRFCFISRVILWSSQPWLYSRRHLTDSRDIFFYSTLYVNSQYTIVHVHYTHFFSPRNESNVLSTSIYCTHIIELLKFSAWIIKSLFLLHPVWLYTTYMLLFCPQSSTMVWHVFVYISRTSLSRHSITILVIYHSRDIKWK